MKQMVFKLIIVGASVVMLIVTVILRIRGGKGGKQ